MGEEESSLDRGRAAVDLDHAPLTRAFLAAHPSMWPSIHRDVPPGWDGEIAFALQALADLAAMTAVAIFIEQIKSKLAGHRIYIHVDDETAGSSAIDKEEVSAQPQSSFLHDSVRERAAVIIDAAAHRCRTLCDRCGLPGTLRNDGGWIRIDCGGACRTDSRRGPRVLTSSDTPKEPLCKHAFSTSS